MGCKQSRASGDVALNYTHAMSPRACPAETTQITPPIPGGVTPPVLPDREPIVVDVNKLPADYQRLIAECWYVDNCLPKPSETSSSKRITTPKCRCVLIKFRCEVPLCAVAISTVSGTMWENVLYPNEPKRPQGIAHLVEHLIYSKPDANAPDVRQWFADRNGDSNACTSDTDMRMWFTVPPKSLQEALRMMLSCMYRRSTYGDKAELQREMLSIDEEYQGMADMYEVSQPATRCIATLRMLPLILIDCPLIQTSRIDLWSTTCKTLFSAGEYCVAIEEGVSSRKPLAQLFHLR